MRISVPVFAGLAALVAACSTIPAPVTPEQISISRGPCFGFCPVYDIQLIGDGKVGFTGVRHTAFVGTKQEAADPDVIASIIGQLAAYRPTDGSRAFECEQAVSDQAAYTIRWQKPGSSPVSLTFDGGCRSPQGAALRSILDAIPAQVGMADEAAQVTRPGASRG